MECREDRAGPDDTGPEGWARASAAVARPSMLILEAMENHWKLLSQRITKSGLCF